MFIIDDLILRSLGIKLPIPFDMIALFELINDVAMSEMYDTEKIKDQIKENRLLYEFEEISKEKYEKENDKLMKKLELAEKAKEMNLDRKITVLGNNKR